VPAHLEVAYVQFERGGPYPGIFLFSSAARMARPVRQLPGGSLELVGALEQAHLAIRCACYPRPSCPAILSAKEALLWPC